MKVVVKTSLMHYSRLSMNQSTEVPPPLGTIVGANVQRLRLSARSTQSELADELAAAGSTFTKAKLANLESGRRLDVGLAELVMLAITLRVPLTELVTPVDGHDDALLADGLSMELTHLQTFLAATYPAVEYKLTKARKEAMIEQGAGRSFAADNSIASKLGVSEGVVIGVADRLWSATATEERDRRVRERLGADATDRKVQATRGHVTRELTAELRAEISNTSRKGTKR